MVIDEDDYSFKQQDRHPDIMQRDTATYLASMVAAKVFAGSVTSLWKLISMHKTGKFAMELTGKSPVELPEIGAINSNDPVM